MRTEKTPKIPKDPQRPPKIPKDGHPETSREALEMFSKLCLTNRSRSCNGLPLCFIEEYACRGTLFVKKVSTSHSAYVATNTKSNEAKIDGF